MTYDEYVDALNTHADQCEQCGVSRKLGSIMGVCGEGAKIVEQWQVAATEALRGAGVLQEKTDEKPS